MAEEEQDQEVGSSRAGFMAAVGMGMMLAVIAIAYIKDGWQSNELRAEFQIGLAAKASNAYVAQEIARLDSAKADRNEVAGLGSSVDRLIGIATTLNSRVVKAEETLAKNRRAAAAAAGSAKKASELAQAARDQLARLDAENKSWQANTVGTLAALPREIDSRVGPVAADLSSFQRSQAAVHAAQDSVNTVHHTAIKAFRAKLRLSDKDMARLAAELEKRLQKQKRRGR